MNTLIKYLQRAVDKRVAMSWADREKIEHYEVSVMDRGCLADPISESLLLFCFYLQFITTMFFLGFLCGKLATPPQRSGFLSRNKDDAG